MKQKPFKHPAVQLCSGAGDQWFGQGQLLLPSFIATQGCLCRSVMVFSLQPPRLTCSCATGGWSQGHLPWRKEQTSGLGAAPSSLYVNKAVFSFWNPGAICVQRAGLWGSRTGGCKTLSAHAGRRIRVLGGKPRGFLRPERFLPFSLGRPPTYSPAWPPKASLSFTAASSEPPESPEHPSSLGTLPEPPLFAGASWLRHIQPPVSPRSI